MSWHCLQELAEESLGESCLDGVQYAQLNTKTILDESSCNDKETDTYLYSRSGMMSGPLTAILGAEKSMSLLGAFLAKISAQPERAPGSKAKIGIMG